MSIRATTSDQIISSLEGLNASDLDFVLAVISARFPRGGRDHKSSGGRGRGGRGRGGRAGRGGNPSTVAPAAAPVPDGGGGAAAPAIAAVAAAPPAVAAPPDHLTAVMMALQPITIHLPEVSRDLAADPPCMSRKSVQQRLNKKRAELQKELKLLFESSVDEYWCFESLNGIQRFRLASIDAQATVDVRLRTNPLPANFSDLIGPLRAMCEERSTSKQVSLFGFFTNDDNRFHPPREDGDDHN